MTPVLYRAGPEIRLPAGCPVPHRIAAAQSERKPHCLEFAVDVIVRVYSDGSMELWATEDLDGLDELFWYVGPRNMPRPPLNMGEHLRIFLGPQAIVAADSACGGSVVKFPS